MCGRLELVSDTIALVGSKDNDWTMGLSELAVVGENTISAWAGCEDYFLVFVAWDGTYTRAPCGMPGEAEVTRELERILGADLNPRLAHVTTWHHIVLWPDSLVGKPLFKTTGRVLPLWKRILTLDFHTTNVFLSQHVEAYLAAHARTECEVRQPEE